MPLYAKTSDDLVDSVIEDRYMIISRMSGGGMGIIYEVEHLLIGRRFALKTLNPEICRDPAVLARFYREARAAAAIGDEHIVEISDMGQLSNGMPYIVMELLEGRDLACEINRKRPMPISDAIEIAMQCCHALESAHSKGIVHRDIKPDNIFLTRKKDGSRFVKILDFGIAKFREASIGLNNSSMTKTGTTMGTPYYMSPEQASGSKDIGPRTDVYAMGVVLYEMLIGQVPFIAKTYPLLMVKILQDDPPSMVELRSDIPLALQEVIFRALSKAPADRFDSIVEFARSLASFAYLAGRPELTESGVKFVEAPKPKNTPRAWENKTKTLISFTSERKLAILGSLAGATLLTLLALLVFRVDRSDDQKPLSGEEHPVMPSPGSRSSTKNALAPSKSNFPKTEKMAKKETTETERRKLLEPFDNADLSPTISSKKSKPRKNVHRKKILAAKYQTIRRDQSIESTGDSTFISTSGIEEGYLNIKTRPRSQIYIDGERIGNTPKTGIALVPGSHVVKLVNPVLGIRKRITVDVPKGKTVTKTLTLIPSTSSTSKKTQKQTDDQSDFDIENNPYNYRSNRSVSIVNHRQTAVSVSLTCGSWNTNNKLAAESRVIVRIPKIDCVISCTGDGSPNCPNQLTVQSTGFSIR